MRKEIKLLCLILVMAMVTFVAPVQIIQADSSKTAGSNQNTPTTVKSVDDINSRLHKAVILYIGSTQALVNDSEVQIDAGSAQVKPVIKNERTLVPVRFIAESLGAKVNWDANTSTVKVSLGKTTVELVIGKTNMKVGTENITLDASAEIIGNRTFIPLRKLVEALGKKVFYDRGLIVISDKDNLFDKTKEKGLIDNVIARVNNLPVVGSYDKLKNLLAKFNVNYSHNTIQRSGTIGIENAKSAEESAPQAVSADSSSMDNGGANSDYSKTNVQVEGVDEADVVKTDGQYLYQVNGKRIIVTKAYPADSMEIKSIVTFTDNNFTPSEIYIDDKYLTVIGTNYNNNSYVYSDGSKKSEVYPINPVQSTVKAIVYDIADKTNIKKIREFEIEGNYVSSRKIGSALYMVANRYAGYYTNENDPGITPCYRDTVVKNDFIKVDYPQIRYFQQMVESNYMVIGAIDLNKIDEAAKVNTYLGAGQNIYASQQNLYVTVNNYSYNTVQINPVLSVDVRTNSAPAVSKEATTAVSGSGSASSTVLPVDKKPIAPSSASNSTSIYKFSLNNSQITYINKGEVPGSILNQFSMDEYNSYFRIATTTGQTWQGDSKNNVYILDELLNTVGKVENIAPGEKIYSTRFMGDRGYMVTFKSVDPLFVIDLKDPRAPSILGALKIPGYSDYLHPYDENHIIGFGKDTVEMGNGAFYQGMKIALFDVTDVSNPIEMFKENIGDRGTDSELLRNHKALLFSKDKNLLAFPVTVMEVKNKDHTNKESALQYGQFAYQGAYVYNIDLVKGFTLKGRITHMTDEDYLKAGNYGYDNYKFIQRILYINDTLYTLSDSVIKANDITQLKEKKTLLIP